MRSALQVRTRGETENWDAKGKRLGAENQRSLGTLPARIHAAFKQHAKDQGFKTMTMKRERMLYDENGKITGFTEEIVDVIDLTKIK